MEPKIEISPTPAPSTLSKLSAFFDKKLGYLMVLPSLIIIVCFALYPVAQAFWISLHTYKLNMPGLGQPFVGLQNYIGLLQDERFLRALYNTFYFSFWSVLLEFIIGLAIALLINRAFVGRGIVRAAVLVPWAIPTVISATMWKFMYNDQLGVVNDILVKLGILDQYRTFLGSPESALWSIILTDVWKTTPFMALLMLAGLQVIPRELYEAAKVDGAGVIQTFFRITLPLLKPAILVALLFRTLDAFRVFDVIVVMTGGGPGNSTESLSMYAHTTMMRYLDFGNGSAIAVITFLCVMLISFFYIRILGVKTEIE